MNIVLVNDVRFENEKKWVQDNGILVKISRIDQEFNGIIDNHASNKPLDGEDINFYNNVDYDKFPEIVSKHVTELKKLIFSEEKFKNVYKRFQ